MPFSSIAFDELDAFGAPGDAEANELEPYQHPEETFLLRAKEGHEVFVSSNDTLTQRLRYKQSRTDLTSEKEKTEVAQTESKLCRNREAMCDETRTGGFQDHAVEQSCEYRQLPQESLSQQLSNPPDGAEQRDFQLDIPKKDGGCWTCFFRKVKCDMCAPTCGVCSILGLVCEFERPTRWHDANPRQEQQDINKLLIKETKANLAESPFQRAASPLVAAEGRQFWNEVGEKDFELRLKTDCKETLHVTRIGKNDAKARKGEIVAGGTISTQEEQVLNLTPSEPETQTSEEWGSQFTEAMFWEVHSLPLGRETSSVVSENARMQLFDLLLYDCMSKYGLCEALTLFGSFEDQSAIKGISELFYQIKSLEDGSTVQEFGKTEIESTADRNDSRAIPGLTDSARMGSPFPALNSSKEFVSQSEKHGSKIVSQNSTSLSGLPAITQDELPAQDGAKPGVLATRMELQIDEQLNSSSSPTSTEVVPRTFGSQSGIGHGMIGDAKVKKGNSNEELNSMVLRRALVVKPEEYGTWWEGCMTTIRSQFRQRDSLDRGIKRLLEVFASTIGITPVQRLNLGDRNKRLEWTCNCGHRSHDDFQELSPNAISELANDMLKAGYVTRAQISSQTNSPSYSLIINVQNTFNGARRRISSLRPSTLPIFNTKPSSVNSVALPCLPIQKCRWLHMCLKKPPYATKLKPLHVCKDEAEREFTDATFFRALRRAYFGGKSLRERLLFKLKKIEFVEFELCPENLVDHILPDRFPPTLDEYDFLPPPPLKRCPPIGTSHMMHLFTSCSAQPPSTHLYLRHIPKRKGHPLSFPPDLGDAITGWGLHFVESLNSALAVTVMFAVSLVLGVVFAICWCIWRQDVQGAFGVASYVTSVITLAVISWQMWAV